MSEGKGIKEDGNHSLSDSDDGLWEVIVTESESPEYDSNESICSEQSLFGSVASGIEVQASDVLMIEHLADEIHARSSDEILTSPSHECQINLDEENNQSAFTYFDNFDLCQQKDLQKLKACSFSHNSENNENPLNQLNKKGDRNSRCSEGTTYAGNKNKMKEMPQKEISSAEKQKQRSQVIENPCTQIFKFMQPKLDNRCEKSFLGNDKSDLLKCADYGSDEFADVEDNVKDFSSNIYESTSDMERLILEKKDAFFLPGGIDVDAQATKEKSSNVPPSRPEVYLLEDENAPSASHHAQNYNIGASCSHTHHHDPKQTPKSDVQKLKFKVQSTAEIENADHKTSPKDSKSSRHKANPLKMKTKVGMRKDKCNVCRVRLGLCAIKCRCGGYYCAKHRYDKEHNCTFDYKSMGAEEIRKNNPRVIAEKIRKL